MIKDTVRLMWEIEVADLLMDGVGIVLTFVVALGIVPEWRSHWATSTATILAITPFLVDLVLEIILITEVGGMGEPLTKLKRSGCFPVGCSYDSIVLLEDMANSIKTLAGFNVAIAVVGAMSSLGQVRGCFQSAASYQTCVSPPPKPASHPTSVLPKPASHRLPKLSNVLAIVDFLSSIAELVLGVASISMNTLPFMENLGSIEEATLDQKSEGFCYVRNPELSATEPAGFQWQTSVHLLWLLPTSAALLSMCTCCCIWSYLEPLNTKNTVIRKVDPDGQVHVVEIQSTRRFPPQLSCM